MKTTIIDPPYPLVTLEEAKVALGESGDDRDGLIGGLILAAQSELDGPLGWVGISVAEQGVEYRVDDFSCPIALPGPIIGAVDITYLDADGAQQSLDPGVYEVLSDGRVVLVSGQSWPTLYQQAEAVRFAYYAGIADPNDPRIAQMKTAIILHVRMTLDGIDAEAARRAIEALVRSMWVPVA
jgi:hypothetical protein